jgi:hypothetical protein
MAVRTLQNLLSQLVSKGNLLSQLVSKGNLLSQLGEPAVTVRGICCHKTRRTCYHSGESPGNIRGTCHYS